MNGVGRALAIAVLAVATLGFGAAGLCGAAFTAMSLSAMVTPPRGENYMAGAWVIAVPSLLIGGGLAWVCGRKLMQLFRLGRR